MAKSKTSFSSTNQPSNRGRKKGVKVRTRVCKKCNTDFVTQESTLLNYTKYHINNALKQNRGDLSNSLQMQLL